MNSQIYVTARQGDRKYNIPLAAKLDWYAIGFLLSTSAACHWEMQVVWHASSPCCGVFFEPMSDSIEPMTSLSPIDTDKVFYK